MLVIGLTGGLASGKSTVANLFAQKNINIIDTDIIAREVVEPGQSAYEKIVKHFGQDVVQDDKQLNRKKLRELVFHNTEQKHWLEKLLHPLIREQVYLQIQTTKSAYCIVVIPLLIENYPFPYVNRILVIDAPMQMQIERVIQRDNISKELAEKIINQQINPMERLKYADDVIHNDGELESLKNQVELLHKKYLTLR